MTTLILAGLGIAGAAFADINEESKSANALADKETDLIEDINEESKSANALADEETDLIEDKNEESKSANSLADEETDLIEGINEETKSANALADEQPDLSEGINEETKSANALADEQPDLSEVDKKKTKHMAEDKRKISFEKKFLDSTDYSIKEEVHEKFRRFSWLTGAYGVTRPNRQIAYPHLYVTVKKGIKKSVVLRELKLEFNCDPKKYFEFRREPKKEPTFTYLSKPSSGGGILAISKDGAPNRISNEDEESGTLQQSGTLTMFCS